MYCIYEENLCNKINFSEFNKELQLVMQPVSKMSELIDEKENMRIRIWMDGCTDRQRDRQRDRQINYR